MNAFFDGLGIANQTPFWWLYLLLTGVMIFSALIFQSKTMPTMIFLPIGNGFAGRFGFEIISLALHVAFIIEHVYVLPFNSNPAALLYETYTDTYTDSFKFGFTMMIISWFLIILAGETWFIIPGITPEVVFGLF